MAKNICKIVTAVENDALKLYNFIYETDKETMCKPIKHTENSLILVSAGSGAFSIENRIQRVSLGDLLFVFTGEESFVTECCGLEFFYINFDGLRADTLFFRFGITKESRYFSGFDGLIPFWRESLLRATDQFVDLAAESMILYTFSRMTAANTETDPLLARIIELSEDSFRDPAFSLAGLADELGYNVKYLSHFFKSKMKVNYTDYLRSLRINYATSLFDHGIESVKNVAMLSGFTDPLYFSTVFKNVVGCSPLAYKKNR